MADGDLIIDGGTVKVEGNWLLVKCLDIKLDADARRSASGGERRALVHGFNDELVINYADDYPGGVTINGEVHVPGKIKQNHVYLESTDLHLDHPDRRSTTGGNRRALVHGFNDELVINYAKDYPGGTVVQGDFEIINGGYLRLKNSNGVNIVSADRFGNMYLGGDGEDGDIVLKDGDSTSRIQLDAQSSQIDLKNTSGFTRVRIKCDDFTSSEWPSWPGGTPPTALYLIQELRRMKEEILKLREELDALG